MHLQSMFQSLRLNAHDTAVTSHGLSSNCNIPIAHGGFFLIICFGHGIRSETYEVFRVFNAKFIKKIISISNFLQLNGHIMSLHDMQ